MKPTRRLTIWIYIQAALTALNVVFGVLTGDWKSWGVAVMCCGGLVALIGARHTVRKANEQRRILNGLDLDHLKRLRDHYDNTDTSADMENGVWES